MIVQLREWYAARTLRERRLLQLMAAIAVPLLIWFVFVMPLSNAYDDALQRQLQAADRNGRVKALAARVAAAGTRAPAAVADLALYLGDSARQRGITADTRAGPAPGSAVVSIASASAPTALEWLRNLEEQGYSVGDVRIAPAGNGSVTVTATLSAVAQ